MHFQLKTRYAIEAILHNFCTERKSHMSLAHTILTTSNAGLVLPNVKPGRYHIWAKTYSVVSCSAAEVTIGLTNPSPFSCFEIVTDGLRENYYSELRSYNASRGVHRCSFPLNMSTAKAGVECDSWTLEVSKKKLFGIFTETVCSASGPIYRIELNLWFTLETPVKQLSLSLLDMAPASPVRVEVFYS